MTAAVRNRALEPSRASACEVRAERKVRTPQGSAPGNARAGRPDGQWHRKDTACGVSIDSAGVGGAQAYDGPPTPVCMCGGLRRRARAQRAKRAGGNRSARYG